VLALSLFYFKKAMKKIKKLINSLFIKNRLIVFKQKGNHEIKF